MTEAQRLQADNERLTGEVAGLRRDVRSRDVRDAIADLSPRLGISNPKLASRLIEIGDEDFDDRGAVKTKTLEQKLEALKRDYPEIAARGRGSADAGAGRASPPNGPSINDRIRERAGR